MSTWYVDRVQERATRTCQRCGHPLAWVAEVGWVDMASNYYDMCEGDPYGNNLPGPGRPPRRRRSRVTAA